MSMAEDSGRHGAPAGDARGLVLRQPDGERAQLQRTDAVAARLLQHLLRSHRLPTGLERQDALVIARVAAWSAAERYDPARGASWDTWVSGRTQHAILEIWRQRQYGGRNRYSRRSLQTVPLTEPLPDCEGMTLADTLPDPRDHYAAVEARELTRLLRGRLRERRWRALEATFLADLPQREWGRQEGISESRVFQIVGDALRDAREVLAL